MDLIDGPRVTDDAMSGAQMAAVDDIPSDSTLLVTLRDREGEPREAVLVRVDGDVRAWLNYCRHVTHVRLDTGAGATRRGDEIVCTNHGAYFASDTGRCTHGPCEGATLPRVEVAVEDGAVSLADDRYEFVRQGPIESDPVDRSSTTNVGF